MVATIHQPLKVTTNGDRTILRDNRTTLIATASNGSGNFFYHWDPVTSVAAYNAGTTETLPLAGNTQFIVTATDAVTGCTGKDTLLVTVSNELNALITFYNAITPNGDGINDLWYMDGIEQYPDNEVMIFNRWGDKIKEFSHYGQNGVFWEGTNAQGKRVPDGTYYFIVKVKDFKNYTGWIQVKSSF
jgi:gliding motility-associated-like protein